MKERKSKQEFPVITSYSIHYTKLYELIEPAAEQDAAEKTLTQSEWRKLNRRELLKLTPIVLAGAFAIPGLRTPLLRKGVALSDWTSSYNFV